MKTENKTKKITLPAVMIALATVLSLVPLYQAPYGGTVTLGSMVPLVLIGIYVKDNRFTVLACFAYSLIQMMLGFSAPPTGTFFAFVAVVLLDYIVAFTVISISAPISRCFGNKGFGIAAGASIAMVARFICHFLSGILIWSVYAPEGQPVWLYSLLYNGGYMLPELVITSVASSLIYAVVKKKDI